MRNSTNKKKLEYYRYKIISMKKPIDNKIDSIVRYSQELNINPNIVYGILLIEQANRGNYLNRLLEKTFILKFTNIAIKKDMSVGLGQIKISTAKRYHPKISEVNISKKLLFDDFNISLVAQIIGSYFKEHPKESTLLGLVKYYTTGDSQSNGSAAVRLYYLLLDWILDEALMDQIL